MSAFIIRASVIARVVWLAMIRRKDAYVLLVLLGGLLGMLMSMNLFGLGSASVYIKDTGILAAWVLGWFLALSAGTRELPWEESSGTIFSLLAKPVTRAEVIVGKWLGVWAGVCTAVAAFYVLVAGVVLVKGGSMGAVTLVQAFVMHCGALSIICAIAIAFSTRANRDAAMSLSFVMTAASFMVVPEIPRLLASETGVRAGILLFAYNVLPHFEVFSTMRTRVAQDMAPVGALIVMQVMAYAAFMTVLFILISLLCYGNKRFTRGQIG